MKQQKSIKIDNIENKTKETGLTPIQEKAINLLLGGNTITDVSNQLGIDRSTIYLWQGKENFQAYYNYLSAKIKFTTESCLIGMYTEAIQAIRDSLNQGNESTRLKAALWLIDNIKTHQIGETDPRIMIKTNCQKSVFEFEPLSTITDTTKYDKLLKENNLLPIR
jgi:hypothetical protein